jgi:lysine-N-methylase
MSLPLRHLPVVQNWDCHVCGSCCKEYLVTISDEERERIEGQAWENDPVVNGLPLFKKRGPWWRRRYQLNHRSDGSCVFLTAEGRCRIHERFGYETKPLPCRLFPFVLIPAGDHWRVGMRFACPSAADNKGRPMRAHDQTLKQFATELAKREGLEVTPAGFNLPRPRLQGRQRMDWPDLLLLVRALLGLIRRREDTMERRLRKCLALAQLCRQARFQEVHGARLGEFLDVLSGTLDSDVAADPTTVPGPTWVGRVLFRQAVALFTRKDHGPDRGIARAGRVALLGAAWRFLKGSGPAPRMHNRIPETTFEEIEKRSSCLAASEAELLERYYSIKIESLQFFGPANANLAFWDGLEVLVLTFPALMWVTRALGEKPSVETVARALTIVDDHFGFNPVLRSRRQRASFRILSASGELPRLVAWYGR